MIFWILNLIQIPGISISYLFIYQYIWIWIGEIVLRSFASNLIRNVGLYFFILSWSQLTNELRSIYSFILWKKLCKTSIISSSVWSHMDQSFHCERSLVMNSIALIHMQLSQIAYSFISFNNSHHLSNMCISFELLSFS